MKSAVETLNPTRVKLTVEVPYEELKPSLDAALKAISSQISIPGFRPGKVPARLVEQRVGKGAVMQEAVNTSLPDLYGQAVEETGVKPLGQPEVDIVELPMEDGEQFVFTAEVDVRPEITLPPYGDLKVEVDALDDASVGEETESRLTTLRERFGTLTAVERPIANGDFITIDLAAVIEGEEIDSVKGISYEVGSGNMLDGLDEALIGRNAEETTTFSAPLAGGDREGEQAEVTVTVGSVKVRELPELDDEFAQLASEFDTMAELREDVAKQARQAKLFEQGVQARDRVLDLLLETVQFEVPQGIVDGEVHSHLEGEGRLNDDEHRAEVRENATKALRSQLLLDAIAEEAKVEVEQQELIEYLVMTAQQYGMDPGQFAAAMDQNNQVPAMVSEVARRKALASVLEQVQVVDTAGSTVDLSAVIETGEVVDDEDDETIETDAAVEEIVTEEILTEEIVTEEIFVEEIFVEEIIKEDAAEADDTDTPAKKAAVRKSPARKAPAEEAASEGEDA